MDDVRYGALVLCGDDNWRKGPFWPAAMAFLFGRRDCFEHLGLRCTIAWYKDRPYLIRIREARHGD